MEQNPVPRQAGQASCLTLRVTAGLAGLRWDIRTMMVGGGREEKWAVCPL